MIPPPPRPDPGSLDDTLHRLPASTAHGPMGHHDGTPKRRFAPIPIETTFQSVRSMASSGPNPELTPEPSPRSPSPTFPEPQLHALQRRQQPKQQRRRFKPQLIETSRRTRRAGDANPATRPADKTDITPYTNHIYVAKHRSRRKHGDLQEDEPVHHMPPTRRETEDEGVKEYLLELAAREAARQIEEAALAAFPNSRAREGGVAHFYFRDSSDSDESVDDSPQEHGQPPGHRRPSNLDLGWWHKHMQEHVSHLADERNDDHGEPNDVEDTLMRTDSDLDKIDRDVPPDAMWTTTTTTRRRRDSDLADVQSLHHSPTLVSPPDDVADERQTDDRPVLVPVAQVDRLGVSLASPPAESPFGRPFAAFGLRPEDPKLLLMRQAASPPMLGKDLTFRSCPSPKQTKLETDHPFVEHGGPREQNRDLSGEGGLWRGYCCRSESNGGFTVPSDLHAAQMIVTPQPPGTPGEPLAADLLSEEPDSLWGSSHSLDDGMLGPGAAEHRPRSGQLVKGPQMLRGIDERLRREKAEAERDEKILQEFDDEFVTQVFNYLSLGYPSMARSFDEELSKISRVSFDELAKHDEKQTATGHMVEMKLQDIPDGARCPRWHALKTYIIEWARQHPDLDNLDPLAWGVRERRGSWAI
ncbi:hypothetical protein RJ55_02394 [Drechmeria coniospora]|nr:hypothetical protein RJ55_02394 [Drechmeria coniospora]